MNYPGMAVVGPKNPLKFMNWGAIACKTGEGMTVRIPTREIYENTR